MDGGGLAEPGRGDHRADGRARPAEGPDRVGLVGAQAGRLGGDGLFHVVRVDGADPAGREVVEQVEYLAFEEQVVNGGVLRRRALGALGQGNAVLGADERPGEVLDGVGGEATGAEGGDVLDDVSLAKSGPAGTEPCFGLDERIDDIVPLQPGPQRGDGPAAERPRRRRRGEHARRPDQGPPAVRS